MQRANNYVAAVDSGESTVGQIRLTTEEPGMAKYLIVNLISP